MTSYQVKLVDLNGKRKRFLIGNVAIEALGQNYLFQDPNNLFTKPQTSTWFSLISCLLKFI